MFFYLAVEAYRAQYQVEIQSAEDREQLDYQLLKVSAQTIYDQYLAPKVSVFGARGISIWRSRYHYLAPEEAGMQKNIHRGAGMMSKIGPLDILKVN